VILYLSTKKRRQKFSTKDEQVSAWIDLNPVCFEIWISLSEYLSTQKDVCPLASVCQGKSFLYSMNEK
jgi:hypothetical protein